MCLSDVDMWQRHCLTVNVQLWRQGTNIALFYKIKDSIRELNYRETKYKIGPKMRDQKCNFANKKKHPNLIIKVKFFVFFFILQ